LGGTGPASEVGTNGRGEKVENGVGWWIECKYCVHMYVNGKVIPAKAIPGMVGRGIKDSVWSGWIQVWYIWYLVRTFVSTTMYPHQHNKKF
jgi:hypothetical protein